MYFPFKSKPLEGFVLKGLITFTLNENKVKEAFLSVEMPAIYLKNFQLDSNFLKVFYKIEKGIKFDTDDYHSCIAEVNIGYVE